MSKDTAPSVWSIPGYTEEPDTRHTMYASPKCNVQYVRLQEDSALQLHALILYRKHVSSQLEVLSERKQPSHHDELIADFLRSQLNRVGKLIQLKETEIRNLKLFQWKE